jgi:hypothetical protein
MERGDFVAEAPKYYATAIAALISRGGVTETSEASVEDQFYRHWPGLYGATQYFRLPVLKSALSFLAGAGLLVEESDPFGPSLYNRSEDFDARWEELIRQPNTPFNRYGRNNNQSWLLGAIIGVNRTYDELKIDQNDFNEPDREWAPLPIDRGEPAAQKVAEALDRTIELARTDNGYSANLPEERAFVLERLNSVLTKFKEGTSVSWAFVKRNALEPLAVLTRRFADAALGISATAAREALTEWLKSHGQELLKKLLE